MSDNRKIQGPTLQVVIDVTYEASEPGPQVIKQGLNAALQHFVGSGGLTFGSDALVESYEAKVVRLEPGAAALDEDELATWLSMQIESGQMSLEDIPRRMARYALALPSDMRNEFAERMGLEDEGQTSESSGTFEPDAKWLVCDGWTHIFVGNKEETTRWVIFLGKEPQLVAAEILDGRTWVALGNGPAADLAASLSDNDVLDPASAKALGCYTAPSIPLWAKPNLTADVQLLRRSSEAGSENLSRPDAPSAQG